jgi:hypothetical protein
MSKIGVLFYKCLPNIFAFVVLIVFLGLLQAWILVIDSSVDAPELDLSEIFSDGSLFFYALSLVCGAAFTILTRREVFFNHEWLNYAVGFAFISILFVALLFYSPDAKEFIKEDLAARHALLVKPDAIISMHPPDMKHLRLYFRLQVACVGVALLM